MKPFIKALSEGITLDSMWRKGTVTSKNESFVQFLGHNVPINSSELLGVRKRNEALVHSFTEVSYMFLFAKLTKLQRKENFDTNPDPDPEWLLICDMCSNTKWSLCHALCNKVSHVIFG